MGLSIDIVDQVADRLQETYQQLEFFQDEIVIVDDAKSTWDNAIYKIESQLLGEIEIVNRAIDDVKDLYATRFTGVSSCRSELFWMATNYSDTAGDVEYTLTCTKLDPNGYTDLVHSQYSGNLVGIDSAYFHYVDPADAGIKTSPLNPDPSLFGFAPKNYYGIKYFDQRYSQDIGDTFVTSFIGSIAPSTAKVVVLQPKDVVGIDTVFEVGQIISCGKTGVWGSTTKIAGVSTGYVNLSQIPSLTGITTNSSLVNVLTVTAATGLGVSAFESVEFRVIDDPDSGPVGGTNGDVTSNGEVYKANQRYYAVPGISTSGGSGATFTVFTNAAGGIATSGISTIIGGVNVDIVGQGGLGYSKGDIVTILGDKIGGTTPADDISFSIFVDNQGRFKYSLPLGDEPSSIIDPFNPETVGIMQTANIGFGASIALDNSGAPKGAQSWDPKNEGWDFSPRMDGTGIVYAPNVGADKSYWRVGFQTAPRISGSTLAYEGQAISSVDDSSITNHLITLSACSASVENSINTAIGIVTTVENSFNDEDGKHKIMIEASNGLRSQRNEMYLRIWGMRQSIGGINQEITKLEGVDSYIKNETIEAIVE